MSALSDSVPSTVSDCNTPHEIPAFLDMVDAQQEVEDAVIEPGAQKKKKKKKPKKSASAKARDAAAATANAKADEVGRPPVLSISRNKHWRYISSYHGPWLQLPLELLESLLALNLDPATLAAPEPRSSLHLPPPSVGTPLLGGKRTGFHAHNYSFPNLSPPDSPRTPSLTPAFPTHPPLGNLPPPFPVPEPGKPTPPPIDPGVFRNVTSIRRLIDEAAELSVRASSGLSSAELNMLRSSSSSSMNPSYSNYNAYGGLTGGGGRSVAMSAMRVHRLRALAVQKLAAAYTADEIASSVMVMQGGSVFDDLAEKVLKVDPNDVDARYVHFFHEKIPSRQLAESTTTEVLDELIELQPQKLEYYRTRGIVHCFRDQYSLATKDFTHALKEARARRKARVAHHHNYSAPSQNGKHGGAGKGGKKKKGGGSGKTKRSAEDEGLEEEGGGDAGADVHVPDNFVPHPSVLPDAPTPLEPQLLFLRGAAYLQHAVHLIESTVLKLEGIHKYPAHSSTGSDGFGASDGGNANRANANNGEIRLSYLEGGRYGGVEVGNPDGPLGRSTGKKAKAYREAFGVAQDAEQNQSNGDKEKIREQITSLIKKGMRDHERFLAHFDTLDAGEHFEPDGGEEWNMAQKVEYAYLLSESIRPGGQSSPPSHHTSFPHGSAFNGYEAPGGFPPPPTTFTTYHPLLVEAHFSILLCLLMLGDFTTLLSTFVRTARVVDGLEGYPVFLPPRSMAQAEFIEVLERLASGWRTGIGAYSVQGLGGAGGRGKEKEKEQLAIEDQPRLDTNDDDLRNDLSSENTGGQENGDSNGDSRPSGSGSSSLSESIISDTNVTASTSSSSSTSPSPTRTTTPVPLSPYAQVLNSSRVLLAPVAARQRAREAERNSKKGGKSSAKKSMSINIPLHGPRVDVILAWLGAVHIPALEAAA
ncbi:hypothetical protein GGX14DRAFT_418855 [Mycena pura]|uniref:Uncharacterized protein n=1 Tax=Mycena pura TaxID=153505 RepID=A0AAD6YRN0_9AGAR|nr:hypothetical protein GGX14DRAFT_418855 [Mycena pura]